MLNIYQNMVAGAVVFYGRRPLRNMVIILVLVSLTLDVLQAHYSLPNARHWHNIIYLVFFSLISKEVYKEVLYARKVSQELLAAAMCGFVLLCLIATFLFYQIEIIWPNSFSNIGGGRYVMNNLNYFSFVTLLTTGYGDITPLSLAAKRVVMFMGLAGHLYTVFMTSIIIGKYLSAGKK